MSALLRHARIWLASIRYSLVRAMMFRGDFLMWALVEFFWMGANVLLVSVIYDHTDSIAGWSKYEMLLLVGTTQLIQRLLMAFFWSNLFELGRNVRSGHFDFFLAQPGSPLFMVSTRKFDLDGLVNVPVALAIVVYAAHQLQLSPGVGQIAAYGLFVVCGLVIHYSLLLAIISLVFWLQSAKGIEGGYFGLTEFSRMPREALRGASAVLFVYLLPVIVVSNVPARVLVHGFDATQAAWLLGVTAFWLVVAVVIFHAGLKRYASASS
ncbi:MAG: ABC-2 family transporter protein [Opitutaceae bacterium]|jgi:ABC-2 type transport system permease protein|nr:ABC-2 family transporter protein [Opitutaceae bacterium]